jgi:hypothetical protein
VGRRRGSRGPAAYPDGDGVVHEEDFVGQERRPAPAEGQATTARSDAWRQRAFVLGMVPGQVEEVAEVLSRPKIAREYRILAADRQALLQLLRNEAILLPVEQVPGLP